MAGEDEESSPTEESVVWSKERSNLDNFQPLYTPFFFNNPFPLSFQKPLWGLFAVPWRHVTGECK